jgi:hypothetical protein
MRTRTRLLATATAVVALGAAGLARPAAASAMTPKDDCDAFQASEIIDAMNAYCPNGWAVMVDCSANSISVDVYGCW